MSIKKGQSFIVNADLKWLKARITNLPAETLRVRLRFRVGQAATAYVRTPGGITAHSLAPDGDGMKLLYPIGINQRSTYGAMETRVA